jgi:hypothetical protein
MSVTRPHLPDPRVTTPELVEQTQNAGNKRSRQSGLDAR